MTSIVIYAAEPAHPTALTDPNNPAVQTARTERTNGMIDAGAKLKVALANADTSQPFGVLSDKEIEDAVCGVIDHFAMQGSGFEPVLEHKAGATSSFYSIIKRPNPATSKFGLTNKNNPKDTRNLDLVGKVDTFDSGGNNYKMTTVAPLTASNANAWDYLYDTVYLDLKAINAGGDDPIRTINYLIATYAFSRCR